MELTGIYDEGRQGEPARRWLREDRLRLLTAGELRSFAEDAGLTVEVLAGGYDLDALRPGDDRAILVARKADARGGAPGDAPDEAPSEAPGDASGDASDSAAAVRNRLRGRTATPSSG